MPKNLNDNEQTYIITHAVNFWKALICSRGWNRKTYLHISIWHHEHRQYIIFHPNICGPDALCAFSTSLYKKYRSYSYIDWDRARHKVQKFRSLKTKPPSWYAYMFWRSSISKQYRHFVWERRRYFSNFEYFCKYWLFMQYHTLYLSKRSTIS
jgi:hypothetical protein